MTAPMSVTPLIGYTPKQHYCTIGNADATGYPTATITGTPGIGQPFTGQQGVLVANPAQAAAGNVGNGTVGALTLDQTTAVDEDWTLTATSATNFTVTGSVSGAKAAATVGTPYVGAAIHFTITAGGTAFVAGDKFTVRVTAT